MSQVQSDAQLTFGSGGVVNPEPGFFDLPGIGILLIFDRTSVPESIERFARRIMKPIAARRRKTRRFPRSKLAIVVRCDIRASVNHGEATSLRHRDIRIRRRQLPIDLSFK
jgi:hypothetical protein